MNVSNNSHHKNLLPLPPTTSTSLLKVEKGEWASAKKAKTRLRYIEVKKFCPARCEEDCHAAPQHRVTAKEVPMATGSLLLSIVFVHFLFEKSSVLDLLVKVAL